MCAGWTWPGRLAGEDFGGGCPTPHMSFAYSISERLRQSIETTPVKISRAPGTLNITISIGIASLENGDAGAEALLHRADQALYRAKRSGRNKVVADAA